PLAQRNRPQVLSLLHLRPSFATRTTGLEPAIRPRLPPSLHWLRRSQQRQLRQQEQQRLTARVEQVGDVVQQVAQDLTVARLRQQLRVDVARRHHQPQQVGLHRRLCAIGRAYLAGQ